MFMMAGLANGSGCCLRIIGDLVTQPNLVHRNRIGLLFPSQSIHTEKVSEQAGGGRQSPASRAHATLTPAISGHRSTDAPLPRIHSVRSGSDAPRREDPESLGATCWVVRFAGRGSRWGPTPVRSGASVPFRSGSHPRLACLTSLAGSLAPPDLLLQPAPLLLLLLLLGIHPLPPSHSKARPASPPLRGSSLPFPRVLRRHSPSRW